MTARDLFANPALYNPLQDLADLGAERLARRRAEKRAAWERFRRWLRERRREEALAEDEAEERDRWAGGFYDEAER